MVERSIFQSSHTLDKGDMSLRIILSSYYPYLPLGILYAQYYGSARICCSHFVALVHNLLHLFTFCCNTLKFNTFCLDFVEMYIILCGQMKNFKCSSCRGGERIQRSYNKDKQVERGPEIKNPSERELAWGQNSILTGYLMFLVSCYAIPKF